MAERFPDKVVVVTGAAGGIGRATAERFASEGANIVAVDVSDSPLDGTVEAVRRLGREALAVGAEVTDATDVRRYAREATGTFGRIDVLVQNAAILGPNHPLEDYPEQAFDKVMAINARGVWLGMKAVVPAMKRSGGGSIINTASTAALAASPFIIAYGASKHAVLGMTQTAAVELAPHGIRVNCICPGPTDTAMMRGAERGYNPDDHEQAHEAWRQSVPLQRYAEPSEMAAAIAFLASDDASYITGSVYTVDGGLMSQQR